MSEDDERLEQMLLATLVHYGIPEPGYGERAFKCPVHGDKVASASVNRGKGVWFCHACGARGTAVDMVMAIEHMNFSDAMDFTFRLAGLTESRSNARPGGRRKSLTRWIPPALRRAT
jgi:DNA primase